MFGVQSSDSSSHQGEVGYFAFLTFPSPKYGNTLQTCVMYMCLRICPVPALLSEHGVQTVGTRGMNVHTVIHTRYITGGDISPLQYVPIFIMESPTCKLSSLLPLFKSITTNVFFSLLPHIRTHTNTGLLNGAHHEEMVSLKLPQSLACTGYILRFSLLVAEAFPVYV